MKSKTLLLLAASASFAVCLLHLVAILIGPAAYRLLGAGEDFAAWAARLPFHIIRPIAPANTPCTDFSTRCAWNSRRMVSVAR